MMESKPHDVITRTESVTYCLYFLIIIGTMAFLYRQLYFGPPFFELSDYAVNAIQIDYAKHFNELFGNYSRWRFNHPGPAFFYTYALGEYLFYDLLPIFASPYQAHAFMGLILQTFFLTVAAGTVTILTNSPFTGLGLALFSIMQFNSPDIWPPHVIVWPLFSLIISAAAVSSGYRRFVPLMLISGGFLIHGHVAQPLFVMPLTALAFALMLRQPHATAVANSRVWVISAGVILLFALPLLIDLSSWDKSNLAQILDHIRTHSGERKPLAASVGYFLNFLLHEFKPPVDKIDDSHFSLAEFSGSHAMMLLLWGVVLVIPTVIAFRKPPHAARHNLAATLFVRRLILFSWLATLLSIIWGVIQDGPMYEFNAKFNYLLIVALCIPAILLVATWLEQLPFQRNLFRLAAGFAVLIISLSPTQKTDAADPESNDPMMPTRVARQLSISGTRPTLLLFRKKDWPKAAGVALALHRQGVPFLVTPEWGFMFRKNVAPQLPQDLSTLNANVWVVKTSANGVDTELEELMNTGNR